MASNGAQFFDKPIDNVGMKSIPGYESYALQHVYTISIPGCAGTRPRLRRPAQGPVRREPRSDASISSTSPNRRPSSIRNAERIGEDDLEDKERDGDRASKCRSHRATTAGDARSSARGPRGQCGRRRRSTRRRHRRALHAAQATIGRLRPGVAVVPPRSRQRARDRPQGQGPSSTRAVPSTTARISPTT